MAEPDWLRLQKLIFCRYVSQKLREVGQKVELKDVKTDFADGVIIVQLIEALSGKTFTGKKLSAAKQKLQMIDNLNKALEFAKSVGVSAQTISAENIADGNEKLILGFLFQIIIKFMKIDEEGAENLDPKEALMLWLKNKTAGYNNVTIENFTKSFHSGLVFCALIHKMRPKLFEFNSLDPNNKTQNLNLALDLGAKYCNIDKYLTAEDIPKLDELSSIIYLNDWYYGVALLQKQDVAAKRIGKLIVLTELHDKMRADYTAASKGLNDWANKKISELSVNKFDNTLEGVQKQIDEFYAYKETEKSKKLTELLDAQALFDNLALRLANNKRPPFKPEISPEALDTKFEELDKAELEKSKALQAEKARQIEIINDGFCKNFADAVKEFTDWLNAKKTALKSNKEEALEKQLADLEQLVSDNAKFDQFFAKISAADDKVKERFITNNKFTTTTKGDCQALWSQFGQMIEKKRTLLKSQIEEKKKSGLTDEQMTEIRDNFNYFDKDKTNFLEKRELRALLQSLGESSTPKDIQAIVDVYDGDKDGKLKFEEFQQFMFKKLGDSNTKEEILESFKYLSYEKDYVVAELLKNLINDLSWKERHVNYLVKEMKPKGEGYDFAQWTEEVFAR